MADPLVNTTARLRAMLEGPPEEAARLLKAGAEASVAEAQAYYGQILLDGRGVERCPEEAVEWFRKAAATGHMMAVNMLGRCYELCWGVIADRALATKFYRQAAEGGLDWGMYNYASALGLGAGVEKDDAEALRWFERAANLGHAKSINLVGVFHEEGRLVAPDPAYARQCYQQAAEGGDFRGQFNYARLLAQEGSIDAAVALIRTAAEAAPPSFVNAMRSYFEASPDGRLRAAAAKL